VLAAGQGREAVLAAVGRLKPEHRSVVVLHYFVDLPYEDIADVLDVDAKTVKSRLYSARQVLKDQLAARGVT
jgi:RNA polymerase sigma-70 factor (ECF subfamily)